ncbi:hypothetical protein GGI07_000552 [Coemansia sp. Benny D115]|nr:hypothetical protein GGI07_000552 [Coemansia sp. Benny D115]
MSDGIFFNVPNELCLLVLRRLGASYRDVCRRWRWLADSDRVWEFLLRAHAVSPEDAGPAEDAGGNKQVFARWYTKYRGFTDSYTRMRRAVLRLEAWAQEACPEIQRSLAAGLGWMGGESVPVRELLQVVGDSEALHDFLVLYHLRDGQRRQQRFLGSGLFGSYECYGEVCSLSWLPSRMLQIVDMGRFRMLVFAWCHATHNYLAVVVGCPPALEPRMLHHVVQMQPRSHRYVDHGLFGDFFCAHVDALASGYHDVRKGVVSMMPNHGPHVGSSITAGVRTTVSVMFCADETPRFRVYRYEVTFEVLSFETLGYPALQLKERYWLTHFREGQYGETAGPGVVGMFPRLTPESPVFKYCSRLQDEVDGFAELLVEGFEGRFTMVPGSLDHPLGDDILLCVPYIHMPVPSEIESPYV